MLDSMTIARIYKCTFKSSKIKVREVHHTCKYEQKTRKGHNLILVHFQNNSCCER